MSPSCPGLGLKSRSGTGALGRSSLSLKGSLEGGFLCLRPLQVGLRSLSCSENYRGPCGGGWFCSVLLGQLWILPCLLRAGVELLLGIQQYQGSLEGVAAARYVGWDKPQTFGLCGSRPPSARREDRGALAGRVAQVSPASIIALPPQDTRLPGEGSEAAAGVSPGLGMALTSLLLRRGHFALLLPPPPRLSSAPSCLECSLHKRCVSKTTISRGPYPGWLTVTRSALFVGWRWESLRQEIGRAHV